MTVLAVIQVVYTNAKKVWDGINQVSNYVKEALADSAVHVAAR